MNTDDEVRRNAQRALEDWYESHRQPNGDDPLRYVVCAGIFALERYRSVFPLAYEDYVTEKNQLIGAGGPALKRILQRYGETRTFASEGGRTTRGAIPAATGLVLRLNAVPGLGDLPSEQRVFLIDGLQQWLGGKVTEFFARERIKLDIDPALPMERLLGAILTSVRGSDATKSGAVAQHLVGAKLELRFRCHGLTIPNHPSNAADQQTGRAGDFLVGDTAFHVTLAPAPALLDKCRENLRAGLRVVLIVPEDRRAAAKQLAELAGLQDRVGVGASLEEFIGQNLEEMGLYSHADIRRQLRDLLQTYNRRVREAESDPSLMFDLPQWLLTDGEV